MVGLPPRHVVGHTQATIVGRSRSSSLLIRATFIVLHDAGRLRERGCEVRMTMRLQMAYGCLMLHRGRRAPVPATADAGQGRLQRINRLSAQLPHAPREPLSKARAHTCPQGRNAVRIGMARMHGRLCFKLFLEWGGQRSTSCPTACMLMQMSCKPITTLNYLCSPILRPSY